MYDNDYSCDKLTKYIDTQIKGAINNIQRHVAIATFVHKKYNILVVTAN